MKYCIYVVGASFDFSKNCLDGLYIMVMHQILVSFALTLVSFALTMVAPEHAPLH